MGTGSLPDITGPDSDLDDVNDIRNALRGDFVGRASSGGAASSGQNLGTAAIPWGTLYANVLNINGQVIDFDNLGVGSTNNSIISGATRSASGQPDFLRAAGTGNGANFDILGATTSLVYTANGTSATISTDINVASLTVAPSSNNTCLINDTDYSDQDYTKYEGEGTGSITIDTAGTEITDRIGEYVALKASSEIMLAYVEDATTLRNVYRGFFFDDSGAPIVREVLSNNDTLTLMSLGWIFGEDNGTTFDVSYRSPYVQYDEPSSPTTDDYWFDITNDVWKRYDGANFIEIDRMLLGVCVVDGTDCIATRSADFSKAFSDLIDMEIELKSTTQVRSADSHNQISVYSNAIRFLDAPVIWDITTDLESGLTEASNTLYYLYITENGDTVISEERPYNRVADLRGFYHPYHTWRYVGVCYNDGSSDLTSANSKNSNQAKVEVFTSSGEYLPLPNVDNAKVTVVGGGGAGGGAVNGGPGGSTSFGSYVSATGGSGGGGGASGSPGAGGSGTGGDLNITGGRGQSPSLHNTYGKGGNGGDSLLGFGGAGAFSTASTIGYDGANYGGGGGGSAETGPVGSHGGGGGGAAILFISNVSDRVTVTIGAGGTKVSGNRVSGGGHGVCIVEY